KNCARSSALRLPSPFAASPIFLFQKSAQNFSCHPPIMYIHVIGIRKGAKLMTGNNVSEEASSAEAHPGLWRNARLATLAPGKEGLGI
ncbi:hypothetical protein ACC738_38050, partial [Rhizobium ruizarguesonis]